MMKQSTSLLKRCLALVMALVLFATSANLGVALQVSAASAQVTDIAKIVTSNYENDLSEAEKALLWSDLLVSDTYEYTVITNEDDLITVDTENAKITAESKFGWEPMAAVITYGGNELTVELTDGVGTYDAAVVGNAFSVEVKYVLTTVVDTSVQETLLGAAALLKQGVQNLDDVAAQAGNLYVLEQAMPSLLDLANNGVQTPMGSAAMNTECANAIKALNKQMEGNGGVLPMSTMISEYEAGSKTAYLLNNGTAMQAEMELLYGRTSKIANLLNQWYTSLGAMIEYGWIDADTAAKIKLLASNCNDLAEGLATVNADPWAAANNPGFVKTDINYTELDKLVAALGETSVVTPKSELVVAYAIVQSNMSMWNVTYTVQLYHVVDNTAVQAYTETRTETLADGATAEEIAAAFEGYEAELLAQWGDVYVEGKFVREAEALPETLTEDLVYVVIINPKNFTVDIAGDVAEYAYGWKVTLPVHEDPTKSYDYKDANGKYYAQGTVVTVEDNMTFTREEGKSYTGSDLYKIIIDNYGTEKIGAILNSGAVKGNEAISYREPSQAELEELVKLEGETLTVQAYASSYAGLNWVPYSYSVDGVEKLFNGATQVNLGADFMEVKVFYRLVMTNHTEAEVRAIFDMVAELVAEAEGQKSVMDRLAESKDDMGQVSKNILSGLPGMLKNYSVSGGGTFSDALVAQMTTTVEDICANCFNGQALKLMSTIDAYNDPNNGGLTYYYQNATSIKSEIKYLSDKLEALLGDPQGKALIAALLNDLNYGQYVEYLDTLNEKMAQINADLAPVNANIDTSSPAKLSALAKALTMDGSVEVENVGSPYVQMGPVIRTAERFVSIEVKVIAGDKSKTISVTVPKGETLSMVDFNTLSNGVGNFIYGELNLNAALYTNNFDTAELQALCQTELVKNYTFTYTWTPKQFTVKVEGAGDQIVTVDDLTIELPAHPNAAFGFGYVYTIGEVTANPGIYTFQVADLLTLFEDGVLTITRTETNANVEALEKMVANINVTMGFEALTLVETDGAYTGINANIATEDMMNLIMGLVMDSGYGYIGLNGEAFISSENGLQLSIQTLINAILNDEEFSNKTVIALGENGKGKLMTASMQLGNSASELSYSDLTFTVNLKSVPAQLTSNVGYIKTASNYVKFYSNEGKLAVEVTLPEQVYGAYAAALIATGNVDKADAATLDQKVALQFVYDYVLAFTGSEMDLVTFNNTLKMLGFNQDITGYNNYYTKALELYNEKISVAISETGAAVDVSIPGKPAIDAMLSVMGMNDPMISNLLGMIKEYNQGGTFEISANASLANGGIKALIVDAQASGLTNKFAAPTTDTGVIAELKTLAGYSVVMLMDDVAGDLTIGGTTILDLNGKNVAGSIKATGTLYIIDSSMDTYKAGGAYTVSGNATILAGNYEGDVSALLQNGYYMDGTTVRNALYYITDENNTVTFVLNGDVYEDEHVDGYLPDVKTLAIDIASDLLINYALSASLAVDGYQLIDVQVKDLVGMYAGDTVDILIKQALSWVNIGEKGLENQDGFEALVNLILADLIDFETITAALNGDGALATHEISLAPWHIEIEHITTGNYATVNVGANHDLEKTFNVALVLESKLNDNLAAITGELAEIVEDETHITVDLPTPEYANKEITIYGGGEAVVSLDLTQKDYATFIGVVLAYGNPAKAQALAAAVNNNDTAALKAVIDGTSVAEIITALKKMARDVDFAAMAAKVGITADVSDAAAVEAIYHLPLCAAGKVLEELGITGMDSKLGGLYNDETGYYELSKEDIFRDTELTARGYTALVELEIFELTLKVKLFGDDCLWGDANHDGVVDTDDAALILQYYVGNDVPNFCTARTDVNGDGFIDPDDASLVLQYYVGTIEKFPVED